MSKRFIHARWGGVFLGLVFGAQGALAQKPECPVSQSWVTNPSPAPITTSDPTNFCGFYQFAIQEYLYLTSPSGGGLVFETFPSLSDLFPGTDTTCADTDTRLVSKFHPNGKRRFFTPAHIKPSDPVHGNLDVGTNPVNGHTQAGSGGVLVDQTKQITYYEQSFNQTFSSFVNACDLTNVECVSAAPSSLRLPAGALEMKTAWRPISQTDPAFTTYYVVPNVTVVVNPDTKQCQTVPYIALVGMHLVFTTPNHPEAIWATFEHVDNAPNGPCSSSMNTQPPSGFKGWAYFDNTSPVNCSQVNQWIKGQQPPYPVSQVVMNYPYGDDNTDSRNIPTIHSINTQVQGFLPANSVWKNYFMVGSLWTSSADGSKGMLPAVNSYVPLQPPANKLMANEFGSRVLANTTMETFTQFPNPAPSSLSSNQLVNCFTCHNGNVPTQSGASTVTPAFKVSHAFFNATDQGSCTANLNTCAASTSSTARKPLAPLPSPKPRGGK